MVGMRSWGCVQHYQWLHSSVVELKSWNWKLLRVAICLNTSVMQKPAGILTSNIDSHNDLWHAIHRQEFHATRRSRRTCTRVVRVNHAASCWEPIDIQNDHVKSTWNVFLYFPGSNPVKSQASKIPYAVNLIVSYPNTKNLTNRTASGLAASKYNWTTQI